MVFYVEYLIVSPTISEIALKIIGSTAKLKDAEVNCFPIDPHKCSKLIFDKENKLIYTIFYYLIVFLTFGTLNLILI